MWWSGQRLCVPGHGGPVHAEASPHGAMGATGSWKTGISASWIESVRGGRSTIAVVCAVLLDWRRAALGPAVARERDLGMAFETVRQNSHTKAEEPSAPCKAAGSLHHDVTAAQMELGPWDGLVAAGTLRSSAAMSEVGVCMGKERQRQTCLRSQAVAHQRRRVYWPPAPAAGVRDLANIAVECIANRNAAPSGIAAQTWVVWPGIVLKHSSRDNVRRAGKGEWRPLCPPASASRPCSR